MRIPADHHNHEAAERILVVGGGIGGLTAATALARRGAAVDLVEIRPALSSLGVGLGLGSNALSALSDIGVDHACLELGAHFDRLELFDDHEQPLTEHIFDRAILHYPPFCAMPRSALHSVLGDAAASAGVNVILGDSPSRIIDEGPQVHIDLASGRSRGPYDVVLGFDGIRSRTRELLFGDAHRPQYTGYGVWRATIPRPNSLTCQRKYLGRAGRPGIGLMPISDTQAYLSHVRPEPEGLRYEKEDFVAMVRESLEGYTGELAEVRSLIDDPSVIVFSPLEVVQVPEPWFKGRTAVAGDAAHAGVPHLTQGAAMAIEDAITLARSLFAGAPVTQALSSYSAARFSRAHFVQEHALRVLHAEQSHDRLQPESADVQRIARSFRGQLAAADAILRTDIFGNAPITQVS